MRRILGIAVILAFAAGAVQAQEVVDTAWMKTSIYLVEGGNLGTVTKAVNDGYWTWTSAVWDGPQTNPYGYTNPAWVEGDYWAFWLHYGVDWSSTYTKHWFKTTLDVCHAKALQEVRLADKYTTEAAPGDILSINDDLYVYVNGGGVAAGGTGVVVAGGTLDPIWAGKFFDAVYFNWTDAPSTGWYIAGGLVLDPTAFNTGTNEIAILTDEFAQWGGLAHPVFKITYSPACHFVDIDIKPGSYPNSINCSSKGVVPVGILGSADFDPTTIDETTIKLGGDNVYGKKGQSLCHWENFDLDGDGHPDDEYTDLVCQIPTYEWITECNATATSAEISGETTSGAYFRGSDSVRFVPDK